MGHTHASTARERVAWVSYLLAHTGEYGVVAPLSRTVGVSRQTLYAWMERGRAALAQAFAPPVAAVADAELERDILTLLVEGHASVRGIRHCLRQVGRRTVSLGTISAVVREAQTRALALVARTAPPRSGPSRWTSSTGAIDGAPTSTSSMCTAERSGRRRGRGRWTGRRGRWCCGQPRSGGCAWGGQ